MKIDKGGAGWIIFILAAVISLVFLVSALVGKARAHDQNKPELNDWYFSLRSKGNAPCCGGPSDDATKLEELQWRTKGGAFEVYVENQWIDVPDSAVVPVPNKDGRALVWLSYADGKPAVRCFMPGQLS